MKREDAEEAIEAIAEVSDFIETLVDRIDNGIKSALESVIDDTKDLNDTTKQVYTNGLAFAYGLTLVLTSLRGALEEKSIEILKDAEDPE